MFAGVAQFTDLAVSVLLSIGKFKFSVRVFYYCKSSYLTRPIFNHQLVESNIRNDGCLYGSLEESIQGLDAPPSNPAYEKSHSIPL